MRETAGEEAGGGAAGAAGWERSLAWWLETEAPSRICSHVTGLPLIVPKDGASCAGGVWAVQLVRH